MAWVLAIISLVSALLPLAEKGMQTAQTIRANQQQPVPAEAGQPNVVFHNGRWWKWDGTQWLVWTNQPQQQLAQGGYANVRR